MITAIIVLGAWIWILCVIVVVQANCIDDLRIRVESYAERANFRLSTAESTVRTQKARLGNIEGWASDVFGHPRPFDPTPF